jgi:hypothetical protein
MNPTDEKSNQYGRNIPQNIPEPSISRNSAYIPDNPDFHPSKDVPQARGCFTTFDIISSDGGD